VPQIGDAGHKDNFAAPPLALDRDRTREALSEYAEELNRIRQDEDLALEDLTEVIGDLVDLEDPRNAHLIKAVVLQEHAAERLRAIRADFDWERRRALRRLRDRLGEAAR
jgi:hypothetical protein